MNPKKQPTHAVVLMRHDEASDSDGFSLLEAFPSLSSATAYAGKYNPELISGDVVIVVKMDSISEVSEHKANNTRYVWFVRYDGYPARVPNRKNSSATYLSAYYDESARHIISAAQNAGVDEKIITKSLYECGSQTFEKLKSQDENARFKLREIKRYLDGEAIRMMHRSDINSDFSNSISSIINSPMDAATDFKFMNAVDVISIIKSHITLGVLLSAATESK